MAKSDSETESRKRHSVTPTAMRSYAQVLKAIAVAHENLAAMMDASELPSIDAGNVKTSLEGIHKLSRFLGAATEAVIENTAAAEMAEFEGAVDTLKRLTRRIADSAEGVSAPQFPSRLPKVAPEPKSDPVDLSLATAAALVKTVDEEGNPKPKRKKRGKP